MLHILLYSDESVIMNHLPEIQSESFYTEMYWRYLLTIIEKLKSTTTKSYNRISLYIAKSKRLALLTVLLWELLLGKRESWDKDERETNPCFLSIQVHSEIEVDEEIYWEKVNKRMVV